MTAAPGSDGVDEGRLVGADRVLAVLAELAEHPEGITLDELATTLASSKPTVHRALASLRRARFADQLGRGVYVLGDEFLRLAFNNHDGRPETARIEPLLKTLANSFGETVHYAVLDGMDVVYRSKVDPALGAVRLTSSVGGRNPAYRTAVGKLLLGLTVDSEADLREWLGERPLEKRTPNTITSPAELFADAQASRARGYGLDNQENEIGVNCVALPIYLSGTPQPTGAISISAVAFRSPLAELLRRLPEIRGTIESHLGQGSTGRE